MIQEQSKSNQNVDLQSKQLMKEGKTLKKMQTLEFQKVEKELEYLIQDRYNIDKRNAKLKEMYEQLKHKTMRDLAKLKNSADQLTQSKQAIYEHLVQIKPKDAEFYLKAVKIDRPKIPQLYEENIIKGAQVEEKEREIRTLNLENEKLKDQLKLMKNQEEFMKIMAINNPQLLANVKEQEDYLYGDEEQIRETDNVVNKYIHNEDSSFQKYREQDKSISQF
ncbi:hypothetical protein pb186bvf_017620 [Paramecium bursaria]